MFCMLHLMARRQLTLRFLKQKHGETFTVLLNADTRRDAEAALTGAMGGGQDIAELTRCLLSPRELW